ncbi:MAG: phosphatase PAP2 family protein [Chloroflexota bacterium]
MSVNIIPKKTTPFFILITTYLVILAGALIVHGYKGSFFLFNSGKYDWLDWPMFIITHFGDSMILGSLLSILLVWKRPHAVINMIIIVVITGLLGQALKTLFFEGWDRPLRVFHESPLVHTMPNYRLFHNSFPSGHSITAMAAFTSLVWSIQPKRTTQILIAFLAIIVSYSRIYLGVHFPADVLTGSLIGILASLLLLPIVNKLADKVKYTSGFKTGIAFLALGLLAAGTWLIRMYFPLI